MARAPSFAGGIQSATADAAMVPEPRDGTKMRQSPWGQDRRDAGAVPPSKQLVWKG